VRHTERFLPYPRATSQDVGKSWSRFELLSKITLARTIGRESAIGGSSGMWQGRGKLNRHKILLTVDASNNGLEIDMWAGLPCAMRLCRQGGYLLGVVSRVSTLRRKAAHGR
jgi:hypothetical protein